MTCNFRPTWHRPWYVLLLVVSTLSPVTILAQLPADSYARIAIPGSKGALEINVGPTYWIEDFNEDGNEVQLRAMGRRDHLLITAFLKRMPFPANAERCRSEWWPQTKRGGTFQREDLDETAIKVGIARVEFIVPAFRGEKIRQKNIHAYLGGRDLCAEIHLSKVEFEPEDQQLFETVLATVRFLPDEPVPSESSSFHYFFKAEHSYMQEDYKTAAKVFQKALDLEIAQRAMNRDQFRMLVVSLGMASIQARDPQRANAALQRAIADDPQYPLFYYLAAGIHADKGEKDECLKLLRLAYRYEDNMIPGDGLLPDPLEGDLFRRFVNDQEFLRAVREMQRR
jgi:tetratricopeptide (TPR) repeat protein